MRGESVIRPRFARLVGGLVLGFSLLLVAPAALAATEVNWPLFHFDPQLDGFNPFQSTLNVLNVPRLTLIWVGIMGDLVDGSSPAIVNGVAYVGSTDGSLYAFNASGCGRSSCAPLWRGPTANGIFSSPAVANGVVYV